MQLLGEPHDARAVVGDELPGLGQPHAVTDPRDERHAQHTLQRSAVLRHRGLPGRQGFRSWRAAPSSKTSPTAAASARSCAFPDGSDADCVLPRIAAGPVDADITVQMLLTADATLRLKDAVAQSIQGVAVPPLNALIAKVVAAGAELHV